MAKGDVDYVKVYFTNGDLIETSMNPKLTDREIKEYYKVGRSFNLGRGDKDSMTKVKRVKIYRIK